MDLQKPRQRLLPLQHFAYKRSRHVQVAIGEMAGGHVFAISMKAKPKVSALIQISLVKCSTFWNCSKSHSLAISIAACPNSKLYLGWKRREREMREVLHVGALLARCTCLGKRAKPHYWGLGLQNLWHASRITVRIHSQHLLPQELIQDSGHWLPCACQIHVLTARHERIELYRIAEPRVSFPKCFGLVKSSG